MNISSTFRAAAIVAAFGSLVGGGAASAETWSQAHPRRAEVIHRLDNQDLRIRTERQEGKISGAQARKLHREDRYVRNEERFMASRHGGQITRGEQRALNSQENRISRQIAQ